MSVCRLLRQIRKLLGIDQAIGFTVVARGWSILSGTLTVLLIARYLDPEEQGYYYTFASLVSLQTVFELGFSFVILQLSAHESAPLCIEPNGRISGSEVGHSRLASVLQLSFRWYSIAAALMVVALMFGGLTFFSTHPQSSNAVHWKLPWSCVVLAVVFTFLMNPAFSFLEGCGYVPEVARMRLAQAVAGSFFALIAFVAKQGLFAPAALILGQAGAGAGFLFLKRQLLLGLLRKDTRGNSVSWRDEIWPFQWRMALSFFCSYFILPLFNPVLFVYRGAAEAGRMGMSLSIASALGTVAFAWINTKAAPFGNMVARSDYKDLDTVFFRTLRQSAALLLGCEALLLVALAVSRDLLPHLASRMLPVRAFGLLLLSIFLNHILYSEAIYLRAHKREPFLLLSIITAILSAACTLFTARPWGATGVAVGYFLSGGIFPLVGGTYVFVRCRRVWHQTSFQNSEGAILMERATEYGAGVPGRG